MHELTPEQKRDKEVTFAIVDMLSSFKLALRSFGHLCEAGADYLEARNRAFFFDNPHPAKTGDAQALWYKGKIPPPKLKRSKKG